MLPAKCLASVLSGPDVLDSALNFETLKLQKNENVMRKRENGKSRQIERFNFKILIKCKIQKQLKIL